MNPRRRTVIVGGTALLLGGATAAAARTPPANQRIAEVEATLRGRIGVAALDTGTGARLAYRGGERFALCSTFKWLLAAAVLSKVERGGSLDQPLSFTAQDVLEYSPVVKLHVAAGRLSIAELCKAAVEVSDNTAANTLLKYIGGPEALTAYLRRNGDSITRLDRVETSLNTNLPGDPRDTTTPDAMLATMRMLLVDDGMSSNARAALLGWLKDCQTGLHRLRAGVPDTWVVGDKTGTGERGAANDVAIMWPPARQPILVAAYCDCATASPDALNAAHGEIGRSVAAAFA